LTLDPGDESWPSYSRDGRLVYFSSDRGEGREIWRIPATGGPEERITRGGGDRAYESTDGRTLFFLRLKTKSVFAMPVAGGPERKVLDCVWGLDFAIGPDGLYSGGCPADASGGKSTVPLEVLDTATGRRRLIGTLESRGASSGSGIAVSPDGKTVLYDKIVAEGAHLMMIENFR
jgi:Tol biopolymer transport system component